MNGGTNGSCDLEILDCIGRKRLKLQGWLKFWGWIKERKYIWRGKKGVKVSFCHTLNGEKDNQNFAVRKKILCQSIEESANENTVCSIAKIWPRYIISIDKIYSKANLSFFELWLIMIINMSNLTKF